MDAKKSKYKLNFYPYQIDAIAHKKQVEKINSEVKELKNSEQFNFIGTLERNIILRQIELLDSLEKSFIERILKY